MVSECCIQDLKRFSILGVLLGLVAATFAGEGRVNWTHLSNLKGDLPRADVGRQAASLILDIDKDGINDFVIAGWSEQTSMVWFRWTSEGWDRYLIDNRRSHIEAGGTYWDIDGDGDLDILQGASWVSNEVWWWENPYPNYVGDKPWTRHTIKDWGQKQHHDQIFGDFDGDGKGSFDAEVISTGIGTHEGRLGDLDGDGDIDILQKDFQKDQRVDIWLNGGTYRAQGAWWDRRFKYG